MRVIVKPDAEIDIWQAHAWYQSIHAGLAQHYLIIYECTDEIIFVHAVFHASRGRTEIIKRIS